jgi:hypothetical protein
MVGADGFIAKSHTHFDAADYNRQLEQTYSMQGPRSSFKFPHRDAIRNSALQWVSARVNSIRTRTDRVPLAAG